MTRCDETQEMLNAFLEGLLSQDEKRRVLEHLGTCQHCRAALEELKRAAQLVQGLDDVEPPPWFTQKVMSRVRQEAERKERNLLSRLFYPLHVKVPIQALASVLIVVLALYVYRSVEPEMKMVQTPPKAAHEDLAISKSEAQQQYDKAGAGAPSAGSRSVPEQRRDKATGTMGEAPRTGVAGIQEKEGATPPAGTAAEPSKPEQKGAAADRQAQEMKAAAPPPIQGESPQAQKAPPKVLARGEAESRVSVETQENAKEARSGFSPQPAGKAGQSSAKKAEVAGFRLHVNDVTTATGEIRELLGELGARGITAESRDRAVVITGELAARQMDELSRRLKLLGRLEEKEAQPSSTEGPVPISIEVSNRP